MVATYTPSPMSTPAPPIPVPTPTPVNIEPEPRVEVVKVTPRVDYVMVIVGLIAIAAVLTLGMFLGLTIADNRSLRSELLNCQWFHR